MAGVGTVYQVKPFYFNILLRNKDEVVAKKVNEKAGTGFFGKVAARAANTVVADEKVLNSLSTRLIENIQKALAEKGIGAKLDQVFQRQYYVVIRVELVETDKMKLVETGKGPEFAKHFGDLLSAIEALGLGDTAGATIDMKIKDKVREGIITSLGTIVPSKLSEAGLNTDFTVVSSEDQAEFLFETLRAMCSK